MSNSKFIKTKPLSGAKYSENTEAAKAWLDSVSPSMCLAKWFHVSMHLTNGRTHSCYHPPTHTIDRNEIATNPKALHNTEQKKIERRQMLAGERPTGCSYCWKIEDGTNPPAEGYRSDRHYRSGEYWAAPYKDLTTELSWDHNVNPTYVEVNFNQACNFKCSYCSPHLSSEWQKEIETFGPYPTRTVHNHLGYLDAAGLMPIKGGRANNPFVDAFWKWWPEMYKHLHMFRMTGGEPLLDMNTFRVLEYISNNPKGDLEIAITSNMCPPDQSLMDKFISALLKIQNYKTSVTTIETIVGVEKITYILNKEAHAIDTLQRFAIETFPGISSEDAELLKAKAEAASNKFQIKTLEDSKACKHFSLYVSVDAWGSRAEYIRNGMNFSKLLENIHRVLFETHFTTITLINTFNLFSVYGFKEFLQGVLDLRRFVNSLQQVEGKNAKIDNYWSRQRVWFDIPVLRSPEWQSIQNLPHSFQAYLEESIKFMELNHISVHGELVGFNDFEIDKAKRNLVWMQTSSELSTESIEGRKVDFYRFFTEHDRRRNTNFTAVFPELIEFLENCKEVSDVRPL